MRPHISLNVRDVHSSVSFYKQLFRTEPQKQTVDYAKFDLTEPALNLSLIARPDCLSRVNHFGIEVSSLAEVESWKTYLTERGMIEKVEQEVACCFALQDKVWVVDPDGHQWEIFSVIEHLSQGSTLFESGCCRPHSGHDKADRTPSHSEGCSC